MRSSVVSSMNLCIDMYIYIIYMSGFKRFFFSREMSFGTYFLLGSCVHTNVEKIVVKELLSAISITITIFVILSYNNVIGSYVGSMIVD